MDTYIQKNLKKTDGYLCWCEKLMDFLHCEKLIDSCKLDIHHIDKISNTWFKQVLENPLNIDVKP